MIGAERRAKEIILPPALRPEYEETTTPQIANIWFDQGERYIRIEMRHSNVIPENNCSGYITTVFKWHQTGKKEVSCWVCGQEEIISLGVIQIEMGIW